MIIAENIMIKIYFPFPRGPTISLISRLSFFLILDLTYISIGLVLTKLPLIFTVRGGTKSLPAYSGVRV